MGRAPPFRQRQFALAGKFGQAKKMSKAIDEQRFKERLGKLVKPAKTDKPE